ncbi:unnamed protein product [Closterium sp. NIES-65]|nr:unnamed protein product [Closterium sp. NIES-65]
MSPKMTTTCEETLEGLVQAWREESSSENVNGQRENPSTVNYPAWANLRAKSQLLLGSVLAVSLLLVMMVIAVSVSSSASLQPFGPTQRGMGSTQQHGVARVAGMVVRGLLETGRAGRRGLQEPLGGSGMGDESNAGATTTSSSSNSSNLYPAGNPDRPEGAATSTSAGNDSRGDGSSSTAETSIISPDGSNTGAGNTRGPTSITPAGNSAVAGNSTGARNSTGAGNFTRTSNATAPSSSTTPGGNSSAASNGTEGGVLQNVTGAAGHGTEGGAVRYFTVGQEAFVWGSPLVTFFRQQATRAALNAFSYANTTAVVGTTRTYHETLHPSSSPFPSPSISSPFPSPSLSSPTSSSRGLGPTVALQTFTFSSPLPPNSSPYVALPNVDTVYGGAFLYLRDQPMVLRTPYMGQGRYYSVGFFQTYYSDFSVNGSRANGPGPNTFTLVGPNWAGELPGDLAPTVIRSPTNDALLLMRVVVSANVSNDLATVLDLYSQVSLQSLSEALGGPAVAPLPNPPLPSSNLSEALQRMTLIGEGLQRDPPANNSANNRVVRMLASINVTQQHGFDPYSVTQQQAAALEAARVVTDQALSTANQIIQINESLIQSDDFWSSSLNWLGHDYDREFFYRATFTSAGGIGALPATEVVYFLTFLAQAVPTLQGLFPGNPATPTPLSGSPLSTPLNTTTPSNTTTPFNTTQTSPEPPSLPSLPPFRRFPPFVPLEGPLCFRLRLTPPPVDSFWSVTVYNSTSLNLLEGVTKYGVGDRTPGLLVSPLLPFTSPLPRPTAPSSFTTAQHLFEPLGGSQQTRSAVVLRAYGPSQLILNGTYRPQPTRSAVVLRAYGPSQLILNGTYRPQPVQLFPPGPTCQGEQQQGGVTLTAPPAGQQEANRTLINPVS